MTEKLAFPAPSEMDKDDANKVIKHKGMTLRDYFAAKAMAAIIAKTPFQSNPDDYTPYDKTAVGAYDYADAMIAARDK